MNDQTKDLLKDLESAVTAIEDAAYDLFLASKHVSHDGFPDAMEKISKLHKQADRLKGYADEVKAGQIIRSKPE